MSGGTGDLFQWIGNFREIDANCQHEAWANGNTVTLKIQSLLGKLAVALCNDFFKAQKLLSCFYALLSTNALSFPFTLSTVSKGERKMRLLFRKKYNMIQTSIHP